jgi:PPOX class probable FMN-dependent enzyme
VVFRGFLEDTNQLKFVTDARSEKIEQIAQVPYGEACWYFPKTREQFRLSGKLILVTHDSVDPSLQTARQRSWQDLSDAARTQFVWSDSDKPTDEDDEAAIDPQILSPTMPLSQFCMLLLDPTQVDHLELRGNPQIRSIYSFSHSIGWSMQAVNANR